MLLMSLSPNPNYLKFPLATHTEICTSPLIYDINLDDQRCVINRKGYSSYSAHSAIFEVGAVAISQCLRYIYYLLRPYYNF